MLVGGRITRIESDLKQVSETGSGQVYEIQANHDGQPDGRLHEETKQRLGSRADRFETKNSRLRRQNARITSGVFYNLPEQKRKRRIEANLVAQ